MLRRLVLPALLLVAVSAHALDPRQAVTEYERLQKWQFSRALPVPAGGITITRDTATWTLRSGSLRIMEPASDGSVTGFVFEGDGRFTMSIPDRYELAQLRRFTRKAELQSVDEAITQLVFRMSDPGVAKQLPAASAPYTPYGVATKRHQSWLIDLALDADARIVEALVDGGSPTIAAVQTADFDWLTYEYDPLRTEEITLTRYRKTIPEVWISLDRPEDRTKDGRPGTRSSAPASLDHIDVKADLTRRGQSGEVGEHGQEAINGQYVVQEMFTGIAATASTLRLGLWSLARDLKAFDEEGNPLTVFRDAIGKRSFQADNRISDDDFVVILPAPLLRGEMQRIRFEYELETANFAPGGLWYPLVPDSQQQKHTARVELTVRKRNEARSMGRLDSKREDDKSETTVWMVDQPTKMVTFSTATHFQEVTVSPAGVPPITAFGPDFQIGNTAKMRNVAADVANSMQWFQNLFTDKIAGDHFYATSIASSHGQAFEGFLHMGEFTWASESPGASELFRAHEVAHEWWGHKVGWRTYRDQWLSEAFAEYSAILFVQNFVKGGDKYFDEILRSYDGIVKGNLAGGFSKFNRPGLIELNPAERGRVGPIGHGYRASTDDIPSGYTIQTYVKGPMVLHMLRMLLRFKSNSDEKFLTLLRDFEHDFSGKNATTEDFRQVLERNTSANWGWFFDAWVYGADIPSYRWRYSVKPGENGVQLLTVDIERSDVASDFVTVIPVRIDLEDGNSAFLFVLSNSAKQTVTQKVASRPKNVVFGPDFSLLASIHKD
jgi:hypothetical protein